MNAAHLPAARKGPVTITLPDEIDMASAPGAGLDLMAALWAGSAVVIADLTKTAFCDGAGAGMLAEAHREAVAAGAELRIVASARVRRVLSITRLDTVLAVYPTLTAALAGVPPA
jgi:anti-anti-sigma factor